MILPRVLFLLTMATLISTNTPAQIRFGVFADCQYCDCETAGSRFYRNSEAKLNKCINHFNQNEDLCFVAGLGDLIDRDLKSFQPVNAILRSSIHPVFNVPGNHDFDVEEKYLDQIPEKLGFNDHGIHQTYHAFEKDGWMVIFLNGNEITFQSNDPEIVAKAQTLFDRVKAEGKPNAYEWNGGMSREQIGWLDEQLQKAGDKKLKTILFCHYPLVPMEAHTLWNAEEVLEVLKKYEGVKLWMNGHNHKGNYMVKQGIHFLTLPGMVETEHQNAFAEVVAAEGFIEIIGYGRVKSRKLTF